MRGVGPPWQLEPAQVGVLPTAPLGRAKMPPTISLQVGMSSAGGCDESPLVAVRKLKRSGRSPSMMDAPSKARKPNGCSSPGTTSSTL